MLQASFALLKTNQEGGKGLSIFEITKIIDLQSEALSFNQAEEMYTGWEACHVCNLQRWIGYP